MSLSAVREEPQTRQLLRVWLLGKRIDDALVRVQTQKQRRSAKSDDYTN